MLLHYYKITCTNPEIPSEQRVWIKQAHDLPSAWRKFITQHFGILKPRAQDYDIAYDHSRSIEAEIRAIRAREEIRADVWAEAEVWAKAEAEGRCVDRKAWAAALKKARAKARAMAEAEEARARARRLPDGDIG